MPKVSVIVTTYNRPDFVKKTINAILNQTFQDFELIVVDNFSNYNFFELIESFNDSRIRPFQNQNNGIIAVNRNIGIKHSKGEFIAFCDDDDLWMPTKLEKQLKYILQIKKSDAKNHLIYTNAICFGDNSKTFKTNNKPINSYDDLIASNQIFFSTVLLNKTRYVKFDVDPIIIASEDYYLWLELSINGYDFHLIEEPLIKYRVSSISVSRFQIKFSHLRYVYVIIKSIMKYKISELNIFQLFKIVFLNFLKFSIKR